MNFGFWSMNAWEGPAPGLLGRALAERGFESLWFGEHTHIPFDSDSYYPTDSRVPDGYAQMLDPILSALQAATEAPDIIVGTAVALPLQHDLLSFAKQLATLDVMTAGRFHLGVGVGWNRPELANHSWVPWRQRYRALAERIEALRRVWRAPEAGFEGKFDRFSPMRAEPRPSRQGGVPVHAGLGGDLGRAHAIRWADGWMPMVFGEGHPERPIARFRAQVADSDRDPASVPISVLLMGDPSPERIELLRKVEVERVILAGGLDLRAQTISQLDIWAETLL